MREFEKWFPSNKDIYVREYEQQKRAWRAALEWVMSINPQEDFIVEIIEKELEEK